MLTTWAPNPHHMRRSGLLRNPVRAGLGLYLFSLVSVLSIAGTMAAAAGFSLSAFGAALRDGSILLGLFWIVVGFLLGSSVNAFLGPAPVIGSRRAPPPIVRPGTALPERSPEVIANLRDRLSDPQQLSLLFAILGILGVIQGFVAYTSAVFGLLVASMLAAGVAILLVATTKPSRPVVSR